MKTYLIASLLVIGSSSVPAAAVAAAGPYQDFVSQVRPIVSSPKVMAALGGDIAFYAITKRSRLEFKVSSHNDSCAVVTLASRSAGPERGATYTVKRAIPAACEHDEADDAAPFFQLRGGFKDSAEKMLTALESPLVPAALGEHQVVTSASISEDPTFVLLWTKSGCGTEVYLKPRSSPKPGRRTYHVTKVRELFCNP